MSERNHVRTMAVSADSTTKFQIPRLNNNNFFNWQYRMGMLLKREGIYHVLTTPKPEDAAAAAEWDKADEKAHSTISLLVEDDQIHPST